MFTWTEYREIRKKYFGENRVDSKTNYQLYKKVQEAKMNLQPAYIQFCGISSASTSVCVPCAPAECKKVGKISPNKEEENSMTHNTERTYLNNRLAEIKYAKMDTIQTQFRIHNDDKPKIYSQLIDAIENGKYEIDSKRAAKIDIYAEDKDFYKIGGPFDGLKFNLDTAPDWKGYEAASESLTKAWIAARDTVNTMDAAAGLKALQDFEAWTPAGPAN